MLFCLLDILHFFVEYALKAAGGGGNTAIAVRGANTAAFITQRKVPVGVR
jgi:20S proteasome alpha/beta subunit